MDDVLSKTVGTSVVSASLKRVQKKDATPGGVVIVGFRSKQDKQTVFKARSRLKDTRYGIGMDADLTCLQLQQERKRVDSYKYLGLSFTPPKT